MKMLHIGLEGERLLAPTFVQDGAIGIDAGHDMPLDVRREQLGMALVQQRDETMRREPAEVAHYFAPGPPCRTPYRAAMVPRCGAEVQGPK